MPGVGILSQSNAGGAANAAIHDPTTANMYFTATGGGAGTITRTDGGNFITAGFKVGQSLQVSGSPLNSTAQEQVFTITAVTASTVTVGASADIQSEGSASSPEKITLTYWTTTAGSTAVYTPAPGWRYGWTIDDSEQRIYQEQIVNSDWIGLIPTGSSFSQNASLIANGTPTISPTGPYIYYDSAFAGVTNANSVTNNAGGFELQQSNNTYITSQGALLTKFHTEISHWYGGHTYSALFQEIDGSETDYHNDISASRNIAINFTGGATGGITVITTGTGNVELSGNVLDPHGVTTINSENGFISSTGANQFLSGQTVVLDANGGSDAANNAGGAIGSALDPINVSVTGTTSGLNANAVNGDINIDAVTGGIAVNSVVSQSQGKITLTAATNLSVASAGAGLVQGGIISLTATGGGIGNSTTTPLLLNTPNPVPGLVDTVTATAQTNVYLQEKTGNMLVNSISTGGNVWLNVPNGSVINANTNSTTDTRTEQQLAAGVWSDLGLTAGTGYQTKVNDTLSSFAGAQDAQYQAYWEDINSGNTTGTGFLQLAAIYGPGGTYATQDPSYNPNVYNGSASVDSVPVYFSGNTVKVPTYFTAAGTAQTAQVYFTAGTNGTITRTDGLSWLTEGFAAGQMISISGSGLDSTGSTSFTSLSVTANVITLATGPTIQNEASATAPETITVQTDATITLPVGGSWTAKGFAVGNAITVTGSGLNSTQPGQTWTITGINGGVAALSPTNPIKTEGSAASPESVIITNNQSGTITRTDGGSFITDGFAVGQSITLSGSAGNSTAAGQTYTITAITAGTITLATQDLIVKEASSTAAETVTLQHTTTDTPDSVTAYFTASTSTTPGTIVRTTGNWLTDGFAVGQTILVGGSAANSTVGATSYTVTAVTATTLTLSLGDTIAAEATAGAPEAITVQHIFAYKMTAAQITALTSGIKEWTPAELLSLFGAGLLKNVTDTVVTVGAPNIIAVNTTILTGFAVGEQTGGTITIPLSYPPNAPTVLTTADQVALAAAERVDVQYLAAPAVTAKVNFVASAGGGTITRTDGGNWSGLAAGEYLAVSAVTGQFTQNQTDGTLFYLIDSISGNVLHIDASTPLVATEPGKTVTLAPVVLDPSFQATAAAKTASVYFVTNTAASGGQIVRTDGGSWIAQGYTVGQLIEITGSAANSTSQDVPDVITAVTATTITLAQDTFVANEASAALPETISIIQGVAPKPIAIQIEQISPITVKMTGALSITATQNVYIDSPIDIRINQVVAGTTTIGSQIQIKGQGSILNGAASQSTPNLQGGDTVLEAAGLNGDPGTIGTATSPIVIASIGNSTVTARALGVVNINSVNTQGGSGNLNLETVYSQNANVILAATGSIIAALDNGFTTIQAATNISLTATTGTIGNIVNGGINYIYVENGGTVFGTAAGNIWISEGDLGLSFDLNMNVGSITSTGGNVTLRAGLSILDGTGNPNGVEVTGTDITLMALFGGIGAAGDPLGLSSNSTTTPDLLTATATMGNIYVNQPNGTLDLNTISDPNNAVFITADNGSIYNAAVPPGTFNVVAADLWLSASGSIGTNTSRIDTEIAVLEAKATTGDVYVDNSGALTIGGSFIADGLGVQAGGNATVTASSPVTVANSIYSAGNLLIIAQNGPVGSQTDGPGNIVINAQDLLKRALAVDAGGTLAILAGDNLTEMQGASIQAGTSILLKSDYQGDLFGVPPRMPTASEFVTIGTTILLAGVVAAPAILIEAGDGPDKINATSTSALTAAYPWTSATYPTQLGRFPGRRPRPR